MKVTCDLPCIDHNQHQACGAHDVRSNCKLQTVGKDDRKMTGLFRRDSSQSDTAMGTKMEMQGTGPRTPKKTCDYAPGLLHRFPSVGLHQHPCHNWNQLLQLHLNFRLTSLAAPHQKREDRESSSAAAGQSLPGAPDRNQATGRKEFSRSEELRLSSDRVQNIAKLLQHDS